MVYKVNVVFTEDEHGYFVYCPELQGCHSQGETFEEAKANIREALDLYIETMSKEELDSALNKEIVTTTMEVKVALASVLDAKAAESMLFKAGYLFARSKGSHRIYLKGSKRIVIPFHSGQSLHPKIVKEVLDAIE